MKLPFTYLQFLGLLLLYSCQQSSFTSESAFYKWWNNPQNGLVKEREIGNLHIEVKYVPPKFSSFNEMKGDQFSKFQLDSLTNIYSKLRTFTITLEPINDLKEHDLLQATSANFQEYRKKVIDLNFNTTDFISLKTGNKTFEPVISRMDNLYDLSPKKKLTVVFASKTIHQDLLSDERLDFVFNDLLFNTGINHFVFNKEEIDQNIVFDFLKL